MPHRRRTAKGHCAGATPTRHPRLTAGMGDAVVTQDRCAVTTRPAGSVTAGSDHHRASSASPVVRPGGAAVTSVASGAGRVSVRADVRGEGAPALNRWGPGAPHPISRRPGRGRCERWGQWKAERRGRGPVARDSEGGAQKREAGTWDGEAKAGAGTGVETGRAGSRTGAGRGRAGSRSGAGTGRAGSGGRRGAGAGRERCSPGESGV